MCGRGARRPQAESRNNHRHAVVVQDLATQWLQSYPCKTKCSQVTEKILRKLLEPSAKPKVIFADLSWESLTQLVKSFPGITVYLRLTVAKQMVLLKERYGRSKEGTSAVLLQSGLDEKWFDDSMERYCYLRKRSRLFRTGNSQ